MRSKLLAAVLACSAVFGLASCGAMLPESSSETETTTGTAAQSYRDHKDRHNGRRL